MKISVNFRYFQIAVILREVRETHPRLEGLYRETKGNWRKGNSQVQKSNLSWLHTEQLLRKGSNNTRKLCEMLVLQYSSSLVVAVNARRKCRRHSVTSLVLTLITQTLRRLWSRQTVVLLSTIRRLRWSRRRSNLTPKISNLEIRTTGSTRPSTTLSCSLCRTHPDPNSTDEPKQTIWHQLQSLRQLCSRAWIRVRS